MTIKLQVDIEDLRYAAAHDPAGVDTGIDRRIELAKLEALLEIGQALVKIRKQLARRP